VQSQQHHRVVVDSEFRTTAVPKLSVKATVAAAVIAVATQSANTASSFSCALVLLLHFCRPSQPHPRMKRSTTRIPCPYPAFHLLWWQLKGEATQSAKHLPISCRPPAAGTLITPRCTSKHSQSTLHPAQEKPTTTYSRLECARLEKLVLPDPAAVTLLYHKGNVSSTKQQAQIVLCQMASCLCIPPHMACFLSPN
jgi:hypothetical protein